MSAQGSWERSGPRSGQICFYDKRLKAETAEELEQAKTPNGLRQRIYEATFHDPLVRRVFTEAYRQGLSGEDLYTFLAYHALVAKQELEARQLDYYNCQINPPIIVNR